MTKAERFSYIYVSILAIALVGWWIYSAFFLKWVPTGQVAIVYNVNRGVDRSGVLKPGRHARGLFDKLIMAPTNIVAANYTSDPDFSTDIKASDSVEVTTKQGLINFDVLVLYRVQEDGIWKVFQNFAQQPIETIQATRIRREIKNAANSISGRFYLEELIGSKRDEANELFTNQLRANLEPLGFTVEHAFFVTAYPSERLAKQFLTIETADIARQVAALQADAALKQKTIALIKAEAEQKAAKIIAASTTEKSTAIQQLEIELIEAEKWDGSHIKVDTSGLNSVFVDPKYLQSGGNK
jgi:regulator of protease activity HflC (stomatin/prohibitin superfamily)